MTNVHFRLVTCVCTFRSVSIELGDVNCDGESRLHSEYLQCMRSMRINPDLAVPLLPLLTLTRMGRD